MDTHTSMNMYTIVNEKKKMITRRRWVAGRLERIVRQCRSSPPVCDRERKRERTKWAKL